MFEEYKQPELASMVAPPLAQYITAKLISPIMQRGDLARKMIAIAVAIRLKCTLVVASLPVNYIIIFTKIHMENFDKNNEKSVRIRFQINYYLSTKRIIIA